MGTSAHAAVAALHARYVQGCAPRGCLRLADLQRTTTRTLPSINCKGTRFSRNVRARSARQKGSQPSSQDWEHPPLGSTHWHSLLHNVFDYVEGIDQPSHPIPPHNVLAQLPQRHRGDSGGRCPEPFDGDHPSQRAVWTLAKLAGGIPV